MEKKTLIQVRKGEVGYPGHTVLRDVDFFLKEGDFVVLTGPNGGGKTTLLKTLAGIVPPLRGKLATDKVRIGYVPQFEKIDPIFPITAQEMVRLGIAGIQSCWDAFSRRGNELDALKQCKADAFSHKLFTQLSGGQRQRVLLARALAVNPNCLLLDEPTSGIDRETREIIAELLTRVNREKGITILMVSHDLHAFESIAKKLYSVSDGVIKEGK